MADDDFDMEPVVPRDRKVKKKKKGGALKVGLIVLLILLVLIGAVAWGAWYFWLSEWYGSPADGEVPVIRADTTSIKVKPKDPGGMAVPDRDKLVYKRMNGEGTPVPSGVERLLPPAEEPTVLPAVPQPNAAAVAPAPPPVTPQAVVPQTSAPVPPSSVATTQPPPNAVPAPTVSVAPAPPPMPTKPAAKDGAPVSLAPKPLQTAPAPTTEPTKPKTQPPVAVATKTPPPAPVRTTRMGGNAYRIQLGAVRSEDAAKKEWRRLKAKHKDVLGSLALSVIRADLGAKGIYYRLRAGPLADRDAADRACGTLKSRKVPCFPVAPGK